MNRYLFLVVCFALVSCEAIQTFAHVVTGGIVPSPSAGSKEAGIQVWNAWFTWLGSWFGITDPQAQTAVTVAAYSRLDNVVKGVVKGTKATHRVVTRKRKAKAVPVADVPSTIKQP